VQWPSCIPETCESERYLRTSNYLRGAERSTIYEAKQQHMFAVEKRSKETIGRQEKTNEKRIAYLVN